jgi:hypothetical protein
MIKTLNFTFFFFVIAFALQNVNAGDTLLLKGEPSNRSFALWQGQIKVDSSKSETNGTRYYTQINLYNS